MTGGSSAIAVATNALMAFAIILLGWMETTELWLDPPVKIVCTGGEVSACAGCRTKPTTGRLHDSDRLLLATIAPLSAAMALSN